MAKESKENVNPVLDDKEQAEKRKKNAEKSAEKVAAEYFENNDVVHNSVLVASDNSIFFPTPQGKNALANHQATLPGELKAARPAKEIYRVAAPPEAGDAE